ncbi:hypothetical protein GUJ93_ZPchr0012g19360 [Zizania palustris]|uniref:Uncharacterized protein n=1 Tax=Zizania palustris TaxID=103762 RepID=A0A8J5WTN0_ZIZPA|nr:hypothetical protein GUJ93_ZPchr0012g19360 [Zizania palustris]
MWCAQWSIGLPARRTGGAQGRTTLAEGRRLPAGVEMAPTRLAGVAACIDFRIAGRVIGVEAARGRGSENLARVWLTASPPFSPPPCASSSASGDGGDDAVGKLGSVEATGAKPRYARRLASACCKSTKACISSAVGMNVVMASDLWNLVALIPNW